MSKLLNLDEAGECIKFIVDSNRCRICDDTAEAWSRFSCGHIACDDCVAKANDCLICLTPPGTERTSPTVDNAAALRSKNANQLLKSLQDTFNVDVYDRHRRSEQLKVEKELFPHCIQAPEKYINRRKSSLCYKNKEISGLIFFPGEQISSVKHLNMEDSSNYVQEWLENNVKVPQKTVRKPFADLEINQQRIPRRADIILAKVLDNIENKPQKKRKRSHFKSALSVVESQLLLDQYLKPAEKGKEFKKIKKQFDEHEKFYEIRNKESDKDESGIVMDDELLVIDDSQSEIVDKDKLAWLAVLEANEKNALKSTCSQKLDCTNINQTVNIQKPEKDTCKYADVNNKVTFYKKGYLLETCSICKNEKFKKHELKQKIPDQFKDVSITIENNSIIATINMSMVQSKPVFEKHSASIQTDISAADLFCKDGHFEVAMDDQNTKAESLMLSQDMFTVDKKTVENQPTILESSILQDSKQVSKIVADSDSDDPANESSIIEVTADVHHSSNQLQNILFELGQDEIQERIKRNDRGHTPTSTNSSDKENFHPNKAKRPKKKKTTKRRKGYDLFELDLIKEDS